MIGARIHFGPAHEWLPLLLGSAAVLLILVDWARRRKLRKW